MGGKITRSGDNTTPAITGTILLLLGLMMLVKDSNNGSLHGSNCIYWCKIFTVLS